jgi:hypothetical protein
MTTFDADKAAGDYAGKPGDQASEASDEAARHIRAFHWPVIARSFHAGAWEAFTAVEHDGGTVSLQSCHGTFLTAELDGNITANADSAQGWEKFRMIHNDDGTVSLETYQHKYVVVTDTGAISSTAHPERDSHKFKRHKNSDGKWVLESCHGKFVTAVKISPHLVVKSVVTAPTEQAMRRVDLGGGRVAFRCAQGTYLSAHEGGIVSANVFTIGRQETFKIIDHQDGTVSFETYSGHYLSARRSGRITANADFIQDWEKFELISMATINVALKQPVTASTFGWHGDPWKATDGKANDGIYQDNASGVCAHTRNETPSWISVDLDQPATVSSLMLVGRACSWSGCSYSKNWTVRVGYFQNASDALCKAEVDAYGGAKVEVSCNQPHPNGRFITIWSDQWIVLCELEAYREEDGSLLFRTFHGKYVATIPATLGHDQRGADSLSDLRNAGFTAKELKGEGFSAVDLKDAGFPYEDLRAAGFGFIDLQLAGFGPEDYIGSHKWISTTRAPQETNIQKVACMKGHPFVWSNLIPKEVPAFNGLPPRERWGQIFDISFIDQPADPCATPVMATMPLGEAKRGFGSDMNNFVNEALVAMYTGRPFSICAPEGIRNLWAENFVDPGLHRCSTCVLPKSIEDVSPGAWAAGAQTSVAEVGASSERAFRLVDIKRFLYKKLFVLRPEVQSALEQLQEELGLTHEPYVGVHIRRGDKRAESGFFRTTEDFAFEAQRLCHALGIKKVFLASDDSSEFEYLRGNMTQLSDSSTELIQVVEQPRLAARTYAQRGALKQSAEQVLINDIMLLIRADAYVGTSSSNLDRFVWFQRDPTTQSVSLDDGGDYLYRSC